MLRKTEKMFWELGESLECPYFLQAETEGGVATSSLVNKGKAELWI